MANVPPKSALVIHSNEFVFDFISDHLALSGWQTLWASTWERALDLLRAGTWSLVFFSRTLSAGSCLLVEKRLERLQPEAHIFLLTDERTREVGESPVRDL